MNGSVGLMFALAVLAGGGSSSPAPRAAFDKASATAALSSAAAAAKSCKKADGPTGSGKVKVTFAPTGKATSAQIDGAPFAGTPVGSCVEGVFKGAKVPAFDGDPVVVSKTFTID